MVARGMPQIVGEASCCTLQDSVDCMPLTAYLPAYDRSI